eukprot:CAMPEP_0175088498 /NCGR_PEP_ID=MMETSP0086_2-20121207/281_1 /TAXON_ID=136419 /ORGANISM="Unknown Unknown, Strain D1" /LENGTH=601 /DNA_ID=CAMNT_0016360937 /DNA_START=24 /DNA_END=1829 /DNA_ORIENTATION=-
MYEQPKPVCRYGSACYRKNAEHRRAFRHPKQPSQTISDRFYESKEASRQSSSTPSDKYVELLHLAEPNKWLAVRNLLETRIHGPQELTSVLSRLQQLQQSKSVSTRTLDAFFSSEASAQEKQHIFDIAVPAMQSLVLQLPSLFPSPDSLPLLKTGENGRVTVTGQQAACLVAVAFFSLHKSRSGFNHPNFDVMFGLNPAPHLFGKLRCIFHYFSRVARELGGPTRLVAFGRYVLSPHHIQDLDSALPVAISQVPPQPLPSASSSSSLSPVSLCGVQVRETGCIEEETVGTIQIDFANKFIGGGVLRSGCVQEEIRFLLSPECLVSLLLCEVMADHEAIYIVGTQQFSRYSGYAKSFSWAGNFLDSTPLNSKGYQQTTIVAIDAIIVKIPHSNRFALNQHTPEKIRRELVKTFAGFSLPEALIGHKINSVRTGNWGCGAFGGSIPLKFVIQWLALSLSNHFRRENRCLIYYPFKDAKAAGIEQFVELLKPAGQISTFEHSSITAADVYRSLLQYSNEVADIAVEQGVFFQGQAPPEVVRSAAKKLHRFEIEKASNLLDASSSFCLDLSRRHLKVQHGFSPKHVLAAAAAVVAAKVVWGKITK